MNSKIKFIPFILALFSILITAFGSKENVEPSLEEKNQLILNYIQANNLNAQQTASGVYYVVLDTQESTRSPERGDLLTLNIEGGYLDGSTITTENPIVRFPYQADIINIQVEDVLSLFKEGDKVKIFISNGNPVVFYDIEIQKIRSEDEQIADYITENELEVEVTNSGLHYVIEEEGTGNNPIQGNFVRVNYRLFDMQNRLLDSSNSAGFSFTLGSGVITGFSEAVALLKQGGAGRFILPSSIAYGIQGTRSILPYSPLVFEIELISVN